MHRRFGILILMLAAAVIASGEMGAAASQCRPIVLKARRVGKSLYLPVSINGQEFWFSFDSGAYQGVVDAYVAKKAGLRVVGEGTVHGTGEGEVPVKHLAAMTMELGGLRIAIPEAFLIELSGTGNPEWMHGLIGAELLEHYIVQMDYEHNLFRIFEPKNFKKTPKAAEVPVVVRNHRFFLSATIDVSDTEKVTHELRIDTGSEDSIADAVVKGAKNVRETTLGHGLGSNFKGYSGVFKAVHIGPFTFQDVWGPGAPNPRIGMEMFRRFIVTFDIRQGKLYLEPNQHLRDPFPPPPSE